MNIFLMSLHGVTTNICRIVDCRIVGLLDCKGNLHAIKERIIQCAMWTNTDKQASICWLPVLLGTLQEHLAVGGFDEQSSAVAAPATSHQHQHFYKQKTCQDRT